MKFDKVSINGFRGIKQLQIDNLTSINLFIGKNNSSKTSILEAIYVLCGAYNPNLLINIDNFRGIILDEANDLRYIFNDLDYKNEISIEASSKSGKYVRSMKVRPNKRKISQTVQTIGIVGNQLNSNVDNDEINELITTFFIKEEHQQKREFKCSVYHNNGVNFQGELPKAFTPDLKANFLGLSSGSVVDMNKIVNDLIINRQQHVLVDILNKIDSKIKGISNGPKTPYLDIDGMQQLIPINLCGDGIKKIFNLVLAMYDSKDGMIFIDEIENGLHFSAYQNLWNTIFHFSKIYNVQVFATTHSYETLKYLNEYLIQPQNIESQKDIISYTVRKLSSGEHKLYGYKFSEIDNAINENIEIR